MVGRPRDVAPPAKDFFRSFSATEFCGRGERQGDRISSWLCVANRSATGIHSLCRNSSRAPQAWSGPPVVHAFLYTVGGLGCKIVRCITSPVNKNSIAFHTRMGFKIEHVAGDCDGVPCTPNYELNGENRVLFVKVL